MNRKVRWMAMTLLGLTLLAVQAPVGAGDKKDKDKDKEEAGALSSYVDRLTTAYRLAELGRADKQPEYLITAASILWDLVSGGEIKVEKATIEYEDDAKKEPVPEAGKMKGFKVQANELLTEAEELAKGDAAILGLIKAIRDRPTRGGVNGPQVRQRVVPGKATDSVQIAFNGGQPARIGVHQVGTNQFVAMSLVNPKGNILYRDRCIVGQANFTPLGQGVWTVRIYNPNTNPIVYRLFTN